MPGSEPVGAPPDGVKLTYDDFVHFPDDGMRHELIDGEHVVTPSPNVRHQRTLANLYGAIGAYLRTRPVGEAFFAPLDVVLSHFDIVVPDLIYVSNERAPDVLTPQHIRGVPNLLVEIASPGTRRRDETLKLRLYERAGVDEYWIVDPDADTIHVCHQRSGGFAKAVELWLDAGDQLTTSLLPGFSVRLHDMFPPKGGSDR